ncbi:hypothetical protein SAMN05421505_106206 [Sinosporangium album]|uniref:Antibiotic biosynthesis monooxygenase n=1 Tax=Sinosporangium album TaxID=504805 RepID=A0A1G7W5H4_9ACTN|nr:hypothetical protein [Sinosporangium album]SDG67188.1 hypothetical protein SAMN05421505_106206 [Sinosporangium album]
MKFVQVIEFDTTHEEQIQSLLDKWRESTVGDRTATHTMLTRDHRRPQHYMAIIEFPSYEEAIRNSELPQTGDLAHRMAALCDGPPRFVDLDLVRDERF